MLYKVVSMIDDAMTRYLVLENVQTGISEQVFDDSAVFSDINFSFMDIDEVYECKIKLFGKVVEEADEWTLELKRNQTSLEFGDSLLTEVSSNEDVFYVLSSELEHIPLDGHFYTQHQGKI